MTTTTTIVAHVQVPLNAGQVHIECKPIELKEVHGPSTVRFLQVTRSLCGTRYAVAEYDVSARVNGDAVPLRILIKEAEELAHDAKARGTANIIENIEEFAAQLAHRVNKNAIRGTLTTVKKVHKRFVTVLDAKRIFFDTEKGKVVRNVTASVTAEFTTLPAPFAVASFIEEVASAATDAVVAAVCEKKDEHHHHHHHIVHHENSYITDHPELDKLAIAIADSAASVTEIVSRVETNKLPKSIIGTGIGLPAISSTETLVELKVPQIAKHAGVAAEWTIFSPAVELVSVVDHDTLYKNIYQYSVGKLVGSAEVKLDFAHIVPRAVQVQSITTSGTITPTVLLAKL